MEMLCKLFRAFSEKFRKKFRGKTAAEVAAEDQEEARKEKEAERERKKPLIIANIRRYPIKVMCKEEVAELPRNVSTDFLKTCPLGTWFISADSNLIPGVTVVCQVVKGDDMFAENWAGLCVPERGINRYRLQLCSADLNR
jgi:hypothetical protein